MSNDCARNWREGFTRRVCLLRKFLLSISRGFLIITSRPYIPTTPTPTLSPAARLAIMEMETNARLEEDARKYYAKPGEAEWGC
jgi:hypothetical protein